MSTADWAFPLLQDFLWNFAKATDPSCYTVLMLPSRKETLDGM